MNSIKSLIFKAIAIGFLLTTAVFQSCERDCDGTGPSVNITNFCDFTVNLEVDIIGDSLYTIMLNSGENKVYFPHETKVKVKAGKASSIISFSRTRNFEAKNCRSYNINLLQNDSSTLHRLDIEFIQEWN